MCRGTLSVLGKRFLNLKGSTLTECSSLQKETVLAQTCFERHPSILENYSALSDSVSENSVLLKVQFSPNSQYHQQN